MADVFTIAKRSDVMSQIRSRGNKATELKFMRLLRGHRITGWRRHIAIPLPKPAASAQSAKRYSVKPDFVFRKQRLAIFVDGCFWHGCPIHATSPRSNREFWRLKLAGNRNRDRNVTRGLRQQNWNVLRFWEHQLDDDSRLVARVRAALARTIVPVT